jgi:hypothetical protein
LLDEAAVVQTPGTTPMSNEDIVRQMREMSPAPTPDGEPPPKP